MKSNVSLAPVMEKAVWDTAQALLKANNTVTTLEIKTKVRTDYSMYYWTQQMVSDIMDRFSKSGKLNYKDTGTYRVYSDPTIVISKTKSKVMPTKKVATKTTSTSTSTSKTNYISRSKAIDMIENNKGRFFTATFTKKDGTERTINCQYLKDQAVSKLGYVKVKEAATGQIKSVNMQTLTSVKLSRQEWKIRK